MTTEFQSGLEQELDVESDQRPSAISLALEFLRGNSAGVALNSLLGQTTSLLKSLRGRAEMIVRLEERDGTDLLGPMPTSTQLNAAGLKLAQNFSLDLADDEQIDEILRALQVEQEKDMANFERIKAKVKCDTGHLARFIEISDQFLQQTTSP